MRPQQNRRMRGRGNSNHNRKGPNPLTRSYESNGPDVKIRGTAQQIADKYSALARDSQSSGDRVIAENYLQHAEHYNRIIMTAQAQQQPREARDGDDQDDRNDYDNSANANNGDGGGDKGQKAPAEGGADGQPVTEGTPAEVGLRSEDEAPRSKGRRKSSANGADNNENAASDNETGKDAAAENEAGGQTDASKKPRRARRPRKDAASSDNNDAESAAKPASDGSKESLPEAAQ